MIKVFWKYEVFAIKVINYAYKVIFVETISCAFRKKTSNGIFLTIWEQLLYLRNSTDVKKHKNIKFEIITGIKRNTLNKNMQRLMMKYTQN
jgi:hypothetical protein